MPRPLRRRDPRRAVRPRWSRRWPRRSPTRGARSACCSAPRTCSPRRPSPPARSPTGSSTRPFAARHTVLLETGPGPRDPLRRHALRGDVRAGSAAASQLPAERADEIREAPGAAEPRPAAHRVQGVVVRDGQTPRRRSDARRARTSGRDGMYMIGQVAALRHDTCTIAAAPPRRCRRGLRASGRAARRRRPPERRRQPADPPRRRRHRRHGLHPAEGARPADVLGEHPRQGRRDHRGARRPLGLAALLRPGPGGPDKINSRWGGFLDDRPFDPLRLRHAAELAALDRAAPAADARGGARRRWPTPATPTGRSRASAPSVILGVGGGVGGPRPAVRLPLRPARAARRTHRPSVLAHRFRSGPRTRSPASC